jgi:hypothetical protein
MPELIKITAERFAALLGSIEPPAAPEVAGLRVELRDYVALLSAFDAADLPPLAGAQLHDPQLQQFLVEDCERVVTREGQRWSLRDEVRLDALTALDRDGLLMRFAGATDGTDAACRMALRYIRGDAPALNRQSIDELRGSLAAAGWLSPTSVRMPEMDEVRARLAIEGMLEPLRMLVADGFFGRTRELQRVVAYTDVPRTGRLAGGSRLRVRLYTSINEHPPLLIYGPGGAGKSTLMARFVLDYIDAADGGRFPFAYLTFDRSELRLEQPLSLLADAAAQLGALFPNVADDASRLVGAVRSVVAATTAHGSGRRSSRGASSYVLGWEGSDEQILVDRFASLVEQAAGTRDVPNVWVIDTFEVAQRQAPTAIDRLWSFLDRLQNACPRLRVVVCGRAPVSDHVTVDLPLGDLDAAAAAEMLRRQLDGLDLPDEFLARIVTAVSAQPVSLRIAVLFIRAAAVDGTSSFDTAESRRDLLLSLSASEVEGVLYRRILDHIDDDDVRRIAHPGLALRRVTPEAIQAILAGPCGLGSVDQGRAQHLFYALSREVSLVEPDSSEGLRVRPVIRRVMLPMIERDNPALLEELRQAALRYYSEQDSLQARVEGLYYRLVLGQSTRSLDQAFDDEAAGFLDAPVEEYPASSQVYLANRLGVTVAPEIRAQADDLSWARQTALAARRLLDAGQAAEALELVTARRGDTVRPFTAALEVEALAALRRYDEALAAASATAQWCGDHQETATFADVALLAARVAEDTGDFGQAVGWLREAERVTGAAGDSAGQLTARVALLRIHRRGATSNSDEARAIRAQVIEAAIKLTPRDRSRNPGLVRELAAEVGDELPDIARDALRLSGLKSSVPSVPSVASEGAPRTTYEAGEDLSELVSDSAAPEVAESVQEALQAETDMDAFLQR